MERDGEFHRYRRHAKSSSASTIVLPMNSNSNVNPNTKTADAGDANPNTNTSSVAGEQRAPPCMVREQDHYMPIANVIRIMRRILPSHAKISDDAKETIQECVSEFISFVTGEANERCQREQRKTVTAEDVLWAMGKLGFDNYIEPLTVFLNRNREFENERGIILRGDHQIHLPYLKRGMDVHGPVGMVQPYGSGFPMGHHLGIFDPSAVGGYYREVPGSVGLGAPLPPRMLWLVLIRLLISSNDQYCLGYSSYRNYVL